jgi:hypothetical protein
MVTMEKEKYTGGRSIITDVGAASSGSGATKVVVKGGS